jgi:hypothetical protein
MVNNRQANRKGRIKVKRLNLFLIVALLFGLVACNTDAITDDETSTPSEATEAYTSEILATVLHEDDNLKVSFIEIYEEPTIEGVFYLRVLIENNYDKRVTISLSDASVNDYSTTIMSGVPMEIDSGGESQQPFIISYNNLDTDELSGVKTIKFSVSVYDDADASLITTTDPVTIEID